MVEYFRPTSIKEAVSLLHSKENIKLIAGGTEINLKYRDLEYLVDLKNLELNYIEKGAGIRIGVTTTIGEIEDSEILRNGAYRALHQSASTFTSSVKHLATIGGNVAESVASSDLSPPLIALDAKAVLTGAYGGRVVPVHKLFMGLRKTILDKEIIVEFIIPEYRNTSSSFQKVGRTEDDLGMTTLAMRLTIEDDKIEDVGIGVGLASPNPLKAEKTERYIINKEINEEVIEEAGDILIQETKPRTSIRASKEYRKRLEKVLLRRALMNCLEDLR